MGYKEEFERYVRERFLPAQEYMLNGPGRAIFKNRTNIREEDLDVVQNGIYGLKIYTLDKSPDKVGYFYIGQSRKIYRRNLVHIWSIIEKDTDQWGFDKNQVNKLFF